MNELDGLLNRYLQHLVYKEQTEAGGKKHYSGYIEGEKQYISFMIDLKALGFLFSTENSNHNKSSRIVFSFEQKRADIRIPYFGSPFQVVKSTYMACSQGGTCEPKKSPKPLMSDHPLSKKPRTRNKLSKKTGCPAFMTVKCLRVYTEDSYKATAYKRGSTENARIMEKLNRDLRTSSPPVGMLRYLILVSPAEEHNHAVISTNLNHRLDSRLKEEIYDYTKRNVCSVETVRDHLSQTVREMFENSDHPRPHAQNRCYYPVDKVIRFHMNQALSAVQNDRDQETLEGCIDRWTAEFPDDSFFYRPYKLPSGGDRKANAEKEAVPSTLLFCHQTRWQRHLLRRYGNDISLLDSAYKTCKYSFPLFFLVVKTNACDCIVGTFVVQRETAVLVEEALSHFKAWCPDWDPEHFLADNSEANVTALDRTFPRAAVYVCPFHREQSWERWLDKKGNVKKKAAAPVLALWRAVAASQIEDDYEGNLQILCDNEAYRSSAHAQRYFCAEWLPVHRTWVDAYRTDHFASRIATNNGVESLNETLKHARLEQLGDKTLSGVIREVVECLLPDVIEKYSVSNIPLDYREYNDAVPEFLRNRPIPFIESVMVRFEEAKAYDASQPTKMGDGMFVVRSEPEADEWCTVDFREADCSCADFARWRLPCKHMCAVFLFTDWDFDRLPTAYREHAYLVADADFLAETGVRIDVEGDAVMADEVGLLMEVHIDDKSEAVDVQTLMDKTREKLRMLHGYTYLQYDPASAVRFADAVASLEEETLLEAHRSVRGLSLRPTDCIVPVVAKRYLPLKTGEVKYSALPRCS